MMKLRWVETREDFVINGDLWGWQGLQSPRVSLPVYSRKHLNKRDFSNFQSLPAISAVDYGRARALAKLEGHRDVVATLQSHYHPSRVVQALSVDLSIGGDVLEGFREVQVILIVLSWKENFSIIQSIQQWPSFKRWKVKANISKRNSILKIYTIYIQFDRIQYWREIFKF